MSRLMKARFLIFTIFFSSILLFGFQSVMMAETHGDEHGHDNAKKEEYNAGKKIIEHIVDAHEWHVLTWGETHVTIPLPIILFYEGELYTFWSSKFHHGHDSYKGFMIAQEGEYKGKIVKVKEGTMERDPEASIPLDLSVTKTVTGVFISIILLCWIFFSVAKAYRRRPNQAPSGFQNFMEPLILFIRDLAKEAIGEKKYERYLPFLLTVFFFIFLNNILGLVPFPPGGVNVTGNLAVTGVLALFTFAITTVTGNRHYWRHIFNTPGVPWWLKIPVPLMPIVEIMGIFTKPFVLMVRLFANITAGHIIVLGFVSLIFIFEQMSTAAGLAVSPVSVFFGVFMNLLELLVAFIQAYVFTLLSALYFGMATEEHH